VDCSDFMMLLMMHSTGWEPERLRHSQNEVTLLFVAQSLNLCVC